MARNSITKSVARFTRPLRRLFNRKDFARLTRIPRTLLTKGGVGQRLIELENRVERLQQGWNQHIPSLLDSMSDALDAAHHAEDGHRRVDAVREDLDRLSARLELHLIELKSSRQNRSPALHEFAGVTLATADDGGVIFSQSARALPVIPGSIRAITVDVRFDIAHYNDGLDEILAAWFELLAPNGRLEIDRIRLVEVLDASGPQDIDVGALRRATDGGVLGSPEFPTDDQLTRALRRCGFEIGESVLAADGIVRTLVGIRPADRRP